VDKVFGWWRRKGQEGQATQRQSTDTPACQGKIPLEKFSARLSRGECYDKPSENSKLGTHSARLPEEFSASAILRGLGFLEGFLVNIHQNVDPQNRKADRVVQTRVFVCACERREK